MSHSRIASDRPMRSLRHGGTDLMHDTIIVRMDVHKATLSVAVADEARCGEVRHLGNFLLLRSSEPAYYAWVRGLTPSRANSAQERRPLLPRRLRWSRSFPRSRLGHCSYSATGCRISRRR